MLHEFIIEPGYVDVAIRFQRVFRPHAELRVDGELVGDIGYADRVGKTWLNDRAATLSVDVNCDPYEMQVKQWQ